MCQLQVNYDTIFTVFTKHVINTLKILLALCNTLMMCQISCSQDWIAVSCESDQQ